MLWKHSRTSVMFSLFRILVWNLPRPCLWCCRPSTAPSSSNPTAKVFEATSCSRGARNRPTRICDCQGDGHPIWTSFVFERSDWRWSSVSSIDSTWIRLSLAVVAPLHQGAYRTHYEQWWGFWQSSSSPLGWRVFWCQRRQSHFWFGVPLTAPFVSSPQIIFAFRLTSKFSHIIRYLVWRQAAASVRTIAGGNLNQLLEFCSCTIFGSKFLRLWLCCGV